MNDDEKITRIVKSIKKDFDTRMDEVQEKVSKDFNEDIEILKQIKDKIKICFGRDYISYVIYGEPCFHDAYNSSCNKKESECETLFEKIISRSVTISNLKHTIDIPLSMSDEIENAKMLWTVVRYDLLDLNIFWGLEFNREYINELPEEQKLAYEHFKNIANYYLTETEKYYKLYKEKSSVKRMVEYAKKEIEESLGIPYDEYEKLDIDEQHKLIEKKTGKKFKYDTSFYIDGVPVEEDSFLSLNEVNEFFDKLKHESKNVIKKILRNKNK